MPEPTWDLDHFLALPRVGALVASPDGRRLVAAVAALTSDRKRFTTALWEVDPRGERRPRRLTRSAPGEQGAAFLPDGSLLFVSARPDPDPASEERPDEEVASLWLLPAEGGEARLVAAAPGGIEGVAVARRSGTVVVAASAFPGSASFDEDAERAKARKEAGVTAQLFETYPIRHWDHWLGPREVRLFVADAPEPDSDARLDLRPLTPHPGRALDGAEFDVTPDGSVVVTTWTDWSDVRHHRTDLVVIDTASGDRRPLSSTPGVDVEQPSCSPDGRRVVCVRSEHGDAARAERPRLHLLDLDGGGEAPLAADLDLWPSSPHWSPDGAAVHVVADQGGRTLPFRVDVATGEVSRLASEGAWSSLTSPTSGPSDLVFGLCSTVASPPVAAALAVGASDQAPRLLPTPGDDVVAPGRVEEVVATADDGQEIHAWLVLPPPGGSEEPAPMAVLIHGGPLGSWSGWHWRWNPHLLAARGWAVLLPDPAISTGYGQAFIERGRGAWGDRPYTDVLAAVDAAVARPDVDESRVAALGGSFGGYMANWVAGHTDRFRAIVTHASLWNLEGFHGTTDVGVWWEREFGDPYEDPARYVENSPHRHVAAIRTPMLVIHGEQDHRVPISEALQLWTDLARHDVEAKFLYFPDENHWILKPANSRLWYETVFAFLDHHVLGRPWERPALL